MPCSGDHIAEPSVTTDAPWACCRDASTRYYERVRSEFERTSAGRRARISSASRRSEEHTSELQSPCNLVCRLLLEKKKIQDTPILVISKDLLTEILCLVKVVEILVCVCAFHCVLVRRSYTRTHFIFLCHVELEVNC